MIRLDPLYHWAPRRLRETILREGLRVLSPSRPALNPVTNEVETPAYPWLCLGTSPRAAWNLVLEPDVEEEGWDLWEVSLGKRDTVSARTDFDVPYINEVRLENSIPADRIFWVGSRYRWPHEGEPK